MFFTDTAECLKHIIRKWETAVVSRFSRHIFAHRTMFRKRLQPIPLLLEIMRSPFCPPIPWRKRWREKHQHIKNYVSTKAEKHSTIQSLKIKSFQSEYHGTLKIPPKYLRFLTYSFHLSLSNSYLSILTFMSLLF